MSLKVTPSSDLRNLMHAIQQSESKIFSRLVWQTHFLDESIHSVGNKKFKTGFDSITAILYVQHNPLFAVDESS